MNILVFILLHVVRCKDCEHPLKSWYCQRDGMLFCKEHYRRRFDEACSRCAVRITGLVMVRHSLFVWIAVLFIVSVVAFAHNFVDAGGYVISVVIKSKIRRSIVSQGM